MTKQNKLTVHIFQSNVSTFRIIIMNLGDNNVNVFSLQELDVSKLNVPVMGGHSGVTIIPVISQANPSVSFPPVSTIDNC